MSVHTIILKRKLPLPKKKTKSKKTGKTTEVICTLNNVSSWIRFGKTKIKNTYKTLLKDYFIPEPEKQYDALNIQYRIIRDSKRNIDKDNVVFALKWIADTLEELGYVENDKVINFESFDTSINKDASETMIEINILSGKKEWIT
jgi:hypothetical protein